MSELRFEDILINAGTDEFDRMNFMTGIVIRYMKLPKKQSSGC